MTDQNNGRLTDVIIREMDPDVENKLVVYYKVYADAGFSDTIRGVEGVLSVEEFNGYIIELDPRYDANYVLAEVEAAIKINKE